MFDCGIAMDWFWMILVVFLFLVGKEGGQMVLWEEELRLQIADPVPWIWCDMWHCGRCGATVGFHGFSHVQAVEP